MNVETKVIKSKVGWLQLGNVSQAGKLFGYNRDSFYRFLKIFMIEVET